MLFYKLWEGGLDLSRKIHKAFKRRGEQVIWAYWIWIIFLCSVRWVSVFVRVLEKPFHWSLASVVKLSTLVKQRGRFNLDLHWCFILYFFKFRSWGFVGRGCGTWRAWSHLLKRPWHDPRFLVCIAFFLFFIASIGLLYPDSIS